jgi:hypothetical protein
MSACTLAAVGSTRGKPSIALAADLFLAVVLGCESFQRRLDDTTTETAKSQLDCLPL